MKGDNEQGFIESKVEDDNKIHDNRYQDDKSQDEKGQDSKKQDEGNQADENQDYKNLKEKVYDKIPISLKALDIIITILIATFIAMMIYFIVR